MPKPTLYYRPGACALAPHILLHWLNVDHDAVLAERDNAELLAISPSGAVPAFRTEDGRGLTQVGAILQHIARMAGRADYLGGTDETLQDEVAMWVSFFTGDFHPAFWPYFVPFQYTTDPSEQMHPAIRDAGIALIRANLDKMNRHLDGREVFLGTGRTVVDAYAVPMLRWAKRIETVQVNDFPAVRHYYEAITQDSDVQAAMRVQGIEA